MEPLTETAIRSSFANCSKGEAQRMQLPGGMHDLDWETLDFFGWVDPQSPTKAYLVAPSSDGPIGILLRRNVGGSSRARMCSVCLTTHSGPNVTLMVAPRAGKAGRAGNTVGVDVCADLACSRYARGILPPSIPPLLKETLSVEERVERVRGNIDAFIERVLEAS